jgi:hypothetical protein
MIARWKADRQQGGDRVGADVPSPGQPEKPQGQMSGVVRRLLGVSPGIGLT